MLLSHFQQIRTFIQMRTNLKVVDNSGAKRVMCIQSLRGKKGARLRDMIIGSIAPKGYRQSIPSLKFQKLAEVTCKMLTAPLYDFVFQQNQQIPIKGNLTKIRRETKCIPDLIF
ncbi:hypothetical protein ZEAMMB73_Zm00001d031000 [Zea mays]|uniref:FANCI solenoid 4 domain-containing protein n=1 Tax=Zea mays TaxID=4577 RepID=A0A1D6KFN8_MAIZE|nr:hypothetical protein ZEAMMB73_Zm00001d031000 [Zea mays]